MLTNQHLLTRLRTNLCHQYEILGAELQGLPTKSATRDGCIHRIYLLLQTCCFPAAT